MNKTKSHLLSVLFLLLMIASLSAQNTGETKTHLVKVEIPVNGQITITPAIPKDGKVVHGTVLSIKTRPATGYAFDSGYFSIPGMWGAMYYESMTPEFNVIIDQPKTLGASFVKEEVLEGFKVIQNVEYATPGKKVLKYDVYSPDNAKNLPCIVIIHGGGWISNTEDIMRGLARELVRSGDYVVFSIDYRWMHLLDGDESPNKMHHLIEDVFGAIIHIMEHAEAYGADPTRIALTGDSAGGHLSASAANFPDKIGDKGFGELEDVHEFLPSYLPKDKTIEKVREEVSRAIKVAAPSYGVFAGGLLTAHMGKESEEAQKAVAPIDHIPNVKERAIPQYLLRGTNDFLIQDANVQAYADALKAAGQKVVYEQVEGAYHAFFDWKPDAQTKGFFKEFGVPYAARMKAFFDVVFYPEKK
ncbi:MAG: alpha/beta hydrolase [Bacteroidetes bacterium]|nr:MAG: alpha/beta hydrolase [Bacteroidota bacterium]